MKYGVIYEVDERFASDNVHDELKDALMDIGFDQQIQKTFFMTSNDTDVLCKVMLLTELPLS